MNIEFIGVGKLGILGVKAITIYSNKRFIK